MEQAEQVQAMEVCRNEYILAMEVCRNKQNSCSRRAAGFHLAVTHPWSLSTAGHLMIVIVIVICSNSNTYQSMISFKCWSSNGSSSLALLIRTYLCKGIDLYSQIFIHFIQPFTLIIIISRTSPSLASRVCLNSKLELHPFTIICRLGSLTIIYRIAPIHN